MLGSLINNIRMILDSLILSSHVQIWEIVNMNLNRDFESP